ncbi:MAG: beta-propeller fold lactonase family protein [Lachnospiraceae bacterium]|nr:beta-propeller fold lactonase family protein [Lachnospiraceae bacterium]
MEDKYVAYISSYTRISDKGIRIYDVDVKAGRMTEREQVSITNSSYITVSHHGKRLYSITDMGVEAFEIEKNGDLKVINIISINGMRGCYLSTDYADEFLFVAGYHDGKITVLKLDKDGGLDHITDEVYLKGMGSIAERNFRPHVSCVKMTRDNKYLCACAIGLDHVMIYALDHDKGTLKLSDIVRCEQESAPKYIKFRRDGKFAYVVHELSNTIDVYEYKDGGNMPVFNRIQKVPTLNDYHAGGSAACAIEFSPDHKYLFASNAGDNSVGAFSIDQKTGMLKKLFVLPISGDYPKDIACFPDMKHIISINHESDTITFFNLNLKNNTIVMNGPEIKAPKGNCVVIMKLES